MPHPRKYPVTEEEMQYPPASIKYMDETRYEGHHTICQTLRDIYHIAGDSEMLSEEKLELIRVKARLATAMAKAMTSKLHEYKNKYEPDSGKNVITK